MFGAVMKGMVICVWCGDKRDVFGVVKVMLTCVW